jgi:transposase
MVKMVAHSITIDAKKYVLMAPDVYADIKTVVGVEKCPSPDNTDYAGKKTIADLLRSGDAIRITCRLENGKNKTVICSAAKFSSAMGALLSKKVAGVDVRSTRIPRRMRLS